MKKELAEKEIQAFLEKMKSMGLTKDAVIKMIEEM